MWDNNVMNFNFTFKESKDLDYEKVVDLFYEVGFLNNHLKRQKYKTAIESAFKNSQYVVSVWDKDNLVGFARVITDKSLFATIWNMIVTPEYQGRGLGKNLLEKCLDQYPKLHFFLIADKHVASFYQKLGFKHCPHGMYLEKGKRVCAIYN